MTAYYLGLFLLQLPWLLVLLAAGRRMVRTHHLYSRLQFYGALIPVLCLAGHCYILDPFFGVDVAAEKTWAYGYTQVEPGAIAIGLLFLITGLILDNRPGKRREPWPAEAAAFNWAAFLMGMLLAYWISLDAAARQELPWTAARFVFTLGLYPFGVTYWMWSGRTPVLGKNSR